MPLMQVQVSDPNCPNCIANSTVELISGVPCRIRVTVVLAPPPQGTAFPGQGETVVYAELKYSDDDGFTATKELSPYNGWTSGTSHTITFYAQTWLTAGDFANTSAELSVKTNLPRTVKQTYFGVQP